MEKGKKEEEKAKIDADKEVSIITTNLKETVNPIKAKYRKTRKRKRENQRKE